MCESSFDKIEHPVALFTDDKFIDTIVARILIIFHFISTVTSCDTIATITLKFRAIYDL